MRTAGATNGAKLRLRTNAARRWQGAVNHFVCNHDANWLVPYRHGRPASSGDRLVFQKEDLVALQFGEGKSVPGWIKKLDLKHVRGKNLDDGANMAHGQALGWLVREQRQNIQEFDRFRSRQGVS